MSNDEGSKSSESKTAPIKETPPPKPWGEGNRALRVAITNTREK